MRSRFVVLQVWSDDVRLFSEISKNWAGIPLETYETVLNFISTTKTETGLRVQSVLNDRTYATGVKISDKRMATLSIRYARTLPRWNYTISPH